MTAARAALRRPLHLTFAGAVLAAGVSPAGVSPGGAPAARPLCDPGWCTLVRPTTAELDAIVAEADRLLARYADDPTPLGRECHALGATMRARAADVRMIAYMWRAEDPDGNVGPVTGDAHSAEPAPGAGTVHIARGFDALNPDRGLPAILQTARHEFAHLNGWRGAGWAADVAARLATDCAPPEPPAEPGWGAPGQNPSSPRVGIR